MNKKQLYLSPEIICEEISLEACLCQSPTVTTEAVGELDDFFSDDEDVL